MLESIMLERTPRVTFKITIFTILKIFFIKILKIFVLLHLWNLVKSSFYDIFCK